MGEPQSAHSTARFEVEGVLRNHRSKPDGGLQPCRCCRDLPGEGHVYAFGVEVPGTVPGCRGPAPKQVKDWLQDVLYPLRAHDGARIKVTVEVEHDAA